MNKQNPLIGLTITAIWLAADRQAIRFDVEGGEPIVARCDADCCSYTWIEHIELPALGFPFQVLHQDDLELPEDKWSEDNDQLIQFYGLKLSTDKGDLVLDYRNESNGYYGGSLVWREDEGYYGGVYGQNKSEMSWEQVTEDI